MSNYSLAAPCGCQIVSWDEGRLTELQPCPTHSAAQELLDAAKRILYELDAEKQSLPKRKPHG